MDSILTSVKKKLGIEEEYEHFDDGDIIDHINSAFFSLNQLGVGPDKPFAIDDDSYVWTDFVPEGEAEAVKSYVALYVKLLFDPPSSSHLVENINQKIRELEFRLLVDAEKDKLYPADMGGVYM